MSKKVDLSGVKPQRAALSPELEIQLREKGIARARKKHEQEQHDLALAEFEQEELVRLQRAAGVAVEDEEEEKVPVFIDLAPFADDIRLNGRIFQHGTVANVGLSTAVVLHDVISRTWRHENEVQGNTKDFNTRRSIKLGPRGLTSEAGTNVGEYRVG